MGVTKHPDTCDWCGKGFNVSEKENKEDHMMKVDDKTILMCERCSPDVQRRVTDDRGDVVLDIPHEPDAEAALFQECRERLSKLKRHVALPDAVMALESTSDDLYSIMGSLSQTESYECSDDCQNIK